MEEGRRKSTLGILCKIFPSQKPRWNIKICGRLHNNNSKASMLRERCNPNPDGDVEGGPKPTEKIIIKWVFFKNCFEVKSSDWKRGRGALYFRASPREAANRHTCESEHHRHHRHRHHHRGYPAHSHHDKIPPWWVNVSNDKGGNMSLTKSHHTWKILLEPDDQCLGHMYWGC